MSGAATSNTSASSDPRPHGETSPSWFTHARTTATALVALAAAVVSLLFTLVPALKPDPRDRVGADVTIFALERNVTIGDWIRRGYPASRRAKLLRQHPDQTAPGELLYIRTTVDGHKHRDVMLRFDLVRSSTQQRVPPKQLDVPPLEFDPMELSAPNERSVHVVWVPDFTREPDGLFVRVALWDDRGILAIADSPHIKDGRFAAAAPSAGG